MIPQKTCRSMNAKVMNDEDRKKRLESPFMPIVPGPIESANILKRENAPLITPKPRPHTVSKD